MLAVDEFSNSPQGLGAAAPQLDRRRSRVLRELWERLALDRLGIRTLEVMLCVGAGDSNSEIALRLGVSVSTVKYHVSKAARTIPPAGRPPNSDEAQPAVVAVIDDDPSVREAIAALIESYGIQTVAFESGADFLDWGATGEASCVVTDYSMPNMNGLELLEELRRRGAKAPVIMITAFPNPKVQAHAQVSGAVGYLEKPVNDERLLELLQQTVGSAH